MASIARTRDTRGAVGLPGPDRAAPARPARVPAAGERPLILAGTGLLFVGLLALILVEYTGLAKDIPVLKAMRFSTLVAYGLMIAVVAKVGPKALVEYPQSKALLAFVLFTGFSVTYAVVRSYVPTDFRTHIDYFGLFMTTAYLVDRKKRLDWLSLTASAVTIFLVLRNLSKLGQEQRTAIFTAGYFMGDGNDFAWGLVTFLPFAVFLLIGKKRPILYRGIGLAALGLGVLAIMGTQSRGAALAIGAMGLFYWVMLAKRKAAAAIALVVLVAGAALFAPSGYMNRLQSIDNYQDDSSAQGRIRAWKASITMAIDYPLGVGAGSFNSAFGRFYMPTDSEGWAPNRWISAHSVYFKVLGEYGFLGLGIIVWIIISSVRVNLRSLWAVRGNPTAYSIPESWPALIAMGIVGYAVGAMFLGGVKYPHLYFLAGLTVGCQRLLAAETDAPGVLVGAPAAAGAGSPAIADASRLPEVSPATARRVAPAGLAPRPASMGKGRFFE